MLLVDAFLFGVALYVRLFLLFSPVFINDIVKLSQRTYIMSNILIAEQRKQDLPSRNVFQDIHLYMTTKIEAIPHGDQNYRFYQTTHFISGRYMDCLWRFLDFSASKDIKVIIRPVFFDSLANNLKLQTQNGFVDLLWQFNRYNKDNHKPLNFILSEYGYIELFRNYYGAKVFELNLLRQLIKNTFNLLPKAILRLIRIVRKCFKQKIFYIMKENQSMNEKQFADKIIKIMMEFRSNEIKKEDATSNELNYYEIQNKIQLQRKQALTKMKNCLKLQGFSIQNLDKEIKKFHFVFQSWSNGKKQAKNNKNKYKNSDIKNVFGVKIIEEIPQKINKSSETDKVSAGAHCKVELSKFKLIMMISVNKQVSKALEVDKNGKGVISEVQRIMELAKKVLINQKQQSLNSFQNELLFLNYIRQRGFQNIATYYLEQQKQKTDKILMDYYPQNLQHFIHSQGKYLSARQQLELIRQIIKGVDWLASNYVCHRDLKPANIMLYDNRVPKIIDFGSCCQIFGQDSYFKVKETRLLGTPNYFHKYRKNMHHYYTRDQYQQHKLFDAYSLGKIMNDIFGDKVPNSLPNIQESIRYMIKRCANEDPAMRLTYQQMLFLLDIIIQYIDIQQWKNN